MRIGILTISDRASQGVYEDKSGPALRAMIEKHFGEAVALMRIVPDDFMELKRALLEWCDDAHLDLILTTGGTGFSPRDVTPEATSQVIDRAAPGLAQAMIAASLQKTPHAMLMRGVAGMRAQTLIVNLPGSPQAACENLAVILPALPHAIELLRGVAGDRHAFDDPIDESKRALGGV